MQLGIENCFCEEPQVLFDVDFFVSSRTVRKPECTRKLVTDFAKDFNRCGSLFDDVLDSYARSLGNIYTLINHRQSY